MGSRYTSVDIARYTFKGVMGSRYTADCQLRYASISILEDLGKLEYDSKEDLGIARWHNKGNKVYPGWHGEMYLRLPKRYALIQI